MSTLKYPEVLPGDVVRILNGQKATVQSASPLNRLACISGPEVPFMEVRWDFFEVIERKASVLKEQDYANEVSFQLAP